MSKLIGLVGYAGSGKGEVAKVLVKDFGFKELAYGDAVKKAVSYVYDIPYESLFDQEFKETPHSNIGGEKPRKAIQYLGTEGVRSVYENAWVDKIKRQIEADPENRYVISDCRYPNEVNLVRELGGEVWGISRKSVNDRARLTLLDRIKKFFGILGYSKYFHSSEKYIPKLMSEADFIISNDGSIEDLEKHVTAFCSIFWKNT